MHPTRLGYGAFTLASIFNMVFALYYWMRVEFIKRLFVVGFFGSIINTIGLVCQVNALAIGPPGPSTALANIQNIILLVTQSVRYMRAPTILEVMGIMVGLTGSLVLTVPQVFVKIGKLIRRKD